ncbi:unnamed protein product [Rhizophagus irregularis]|nr:unnamed protein product [Rhizophagus irregularis]
MVKNCFSGITQDPNTKEYMIILKSLQLWESYPNDDYQEHVTINSLTNSEDMTEKRWFCVKVALKSLDDSSDINSEFLNEIKSYISDHFTFIVKCFGITQDPNTKDYMMVLEYCERGDLRNCLNELNESNSFVSCKVKLGILRRITRGLLNIHNAGLIHKDFHSVSQCLDCELDELDLNQDDKTTIIKFLET